MRFMEYRWHIFLANLEPVIGFEEGRTRPILIISEEEINQILPIVNVLPITSKKPDRKIYPNEFLLPSKKTGLLKESIVLCHQIRTIDKKRLIKKIGEIKDIEIQEDIIDVLCFQLGIIR